jgi:hypothetical protein
MRDGRLLQRGQDVDDGRRDLLCARSASGRPARAR